MGKLLVDQLIERCLKQAWKCALLPLKLDTGRHCMTLKLVRLTKKGAVAVFALRREQWWRRCAGLKLLLDSDYGGALEPTTGSAVHNWLLVL